MKFIYYPKCSTCKKALKHIQSMNIDCEYIDITKNTPTQEELKHYIKLYNKGIKAFFNTSGKLYRELKLKDQVNHFTLDEAVKLLSQNGMLIKRPLLLKDDTILVGYNDKEYNQLLCDEVII